MLGTSALFIDVENYIINTDRAARSRLGLPDPSPTDPVVIDIRTELAYLQVLAFKAADGRRLTIQRGYADFDRAFSLRQRDPTWDNRATKILMDIGIEPVQIYSYSQKNAADLRLIRDATELMVTNSSLEQFIIVSGDGGYIPLILDIRRKGAEVVVIAPEINACERLQSFSDKYFTFKNGCVERGADQEMMRTNFMQFLILLKEKHPDIHLMPGPKWESFCERAYYVLSNRPPSLLNELESQLLLEPYPKGQLELTPEENKGGLAQISKAGCFLPGPANADGDQKMDLVNGKIILDSAITSWQSLHARVSKWLVEWYVGQGHDRRLVELALLRGGLCLI